MSLRTDARFAATVARGRPFNVLVQLTNRCNMTCGFCDFWPNGAPPHAELDLAGHQALSRGLHEEVGCLLVSLEGGEPTVRSDLPELVDAWSEHHLTALFTNGWKMTEPLARRLWSAGLTHASVSIDYADAARHDAVRGVDGATERAWQAVRLLRDTAPKGGRQVHVMTVVMADNVDQLPRLFAQSAAEGVGQQLTLLSVNGDRRGRHGHQLPPPGTGAALKALWKAHAHVRFLGEYFDGVEAFLSDGPLPRCRAGEVGFNVDHLGNLSPCIERLGEPVGNVRDTPLPELLRRLRRASAALATCQQCYTACRGFQQALGDPTWRTWRDLALRTRV